jgi:hypothetical protein
MNFATESHFDARSLPSRGVLLADIDSLQQDNKVIIDIGSLWSYIKDGQRSSQ